MANMAVYDQDIYETKLTKFGGVDFSSIPTQVKSTRSPDAVNMIADEKFFPVKRPGYVTQASYAGEIFGLHVLAGETTNLVVHAGNSLYRQGDSEPIYDDMAEAKSQSFVMGGALYILDGKTFLRVSETDAGLSAVPVRDVAFVPTTSLNRTPSGAAASGEDPGVYEAVNLLTNKRINSFVGDGTSRDFQLDSFPVDPDSVTVYENGAEITSFVVDVDDGIVSLYAPGANGAGVDNIVIHFSVLTESNQTVIDKCRICGLFGGDNDTRVFLSGNPDMPNRDWQSGLYEPTYFPDTGYTDIGSDASAIMGYARQYSAQIVVKDGNAQDATQWLRTFALDSASRPVYPLAQGAVGAGAISMYCFDKLNDVPLFLARTGVHGIFGTYVSMERTVRDVSSLVNVRLSSEADLQNAIAIELHGKYYLFINGHVYIADGAQTYSANGTQFEWYYWDNIPAVSAAVFEDRLWFGTADGRVCRMFKLGELDCYQDDGEAYSCWWAIPMSVFDDLYQRKTINDVAYMLMPFVRSEYKVYYRSDRREWTLIKSASLGLMDFNDVDFNDFSFICNVSPEVSRTRRKERKAELFQLKIQNDTIYTGFGLLGITIIWQPVGRVK